MPWLFRKDHATPSAEDRRLRERENRLANLDHYRVLERARSARYRQRRAA
jgi:hypothetical protein